MMTALRVLGHLVRGRVALWQCYTSVTWRTCATCLAWHGRIVADPQSFPNHAGCARELRRFPVWQLAAHRAQRQRMVARAREELERRRLFSTASALLGTDPARSLGLFDQAATIDVYLPEIEALTHEPALADPDLRAQLREILVKRWRSKFAKERYERQPEPARFAQEAWGVSHIREILP